MIGDNMNTELPGQPPKPLTESAGSPTLAELIPEYRTFLEKLALFLEDEERSSCKADNPSPGLPNDPSR